jgi:hypothetical protein
MASLHTRNLYKKLIIWSKEKFKSFRTSLVISQQKRLNKFHESLYDSVKKCTEYNQWASSWLSIKYIYLVRTFIKWIIITKGLNPEKDEFVFRLCYFLSLPHIVDYFYYHQNNKFIKPFVKVMSQEQYITSLFILQCISMPSYRIDYEKIELLFEFKNLWPLIISKGIDYRFFSYDLTDLKKQFEFIQKTTTTFIHFLESNKYEGLVDFLKLYIASPPIGFSESTKTVYEAFRHLENETLSISGISIPVYKLLENKQKIRAKRLGFIFNSLTSGVENRLVRNMLEYLPESYHAVMIGINDKEYPSSLASTLTERKFELVKMDNADLREKINDIRSLDLDVVFYCSPLWGKFLGSIGLIATARVAPIQIVYIGDIVTSGLSSCDYFILPSMIDNPQIGKRFTEKILLVPLLYRPLVIQNIHNGESLTRHSPKNKLVFISTAHMWKLNGDTIDAWAQILKQVDGAVIRLAPCTTPFHKSYLPVLQDLIACKCRKWGVAVKRFEIIRDFGSERIKKHLAMADIFLDSFPYTGSISIIEALGESLPIVSLTGDSYPESLSKDLLMQYKVAEDTLVSSIDAYIQKAIILANNSILREKVSQKIIKNVAQINKCLDNRTSYIEFWKKIDELIPN